MSRSSVFVTFNRRCPHFFVDDCILAGAHLHILAVTPVITLFHQLVHFA